MKYGRDAVEAVQKVYLGVGKVITSDEARTLVNEASCATLAVPGPDFGADASTDNGDMNNDDPPAG